MRHLGSLLAGLLVAPVVWVLTGYAQVDLAHHLTGRDHAYPTSQFWPALLLLAVTGLILGLVASTRLSPVGPGVAGLFYLVATGYWLAVPRHIYRALPTSVAGEQGVLTRPLETGIIPLLGGLLVVALFATTRWPRWTIEPPGPSAEPYPTDVLPDDDYYSRHPTDETAILPGYEEESPTRQFQPPG